MFGLFKKKEAPLPDVSTIVPRIKHTDFLVAAGEAVKKEEDYPVTEPFVADLLISYAFDLPETFQMVSARDVQRLSLSSEQLRVTAIANLKKRLENIALLGEPPVMKAMMGKRLTACLLLVDGFWQTLATKVPPDILVGVPSRDVILFSSTRSKNDGIRLLREEVAEIHAQETTHGLTRHLLVRRGDKWEVFDDAEKVETVS